MKKYSFLLSLVFICQIAALGQTVIVKSVRSNGLIENADKILFQSKTIALDNVTINCKEVEVSDEVRKIVITGKVLIICNKFTLKGTKEPVRIAGDNGSLTIEYANSFTQESQKMLEIDKASAIKLIFKKKNGSTAMLQ